MKALILSCALLTLPVLALEPLDSQALGEVTGQGGVYLSGDLTINDTGGPLNRDGPSQNGYSWQTACGVNTTDKRCGGRIAVNTGQSGGWLVLDNIRGRFAFEGLTLTTRRIDSGFDGDGVNFNRDVMEIGLPDQLDYNDVSFTIANSNAPRPTDAGFQQTDIMTLNINGTVNQQGNVLLFPTGAP